MVQGLNLPRFVLVYLGLRIGVPILLFAIREYFGFDLTSSAVEIIPIMIAAMDQGTQYANKNATPATNGQMWRFAFAMGVLGALLSAMVIFVAVKLSPDFAGPLMTSAVGAVVGGLALAGLIIFPLLARWFFGQGMRNAYKLRDRKAAEKK